MRFVALKSVADVIMGQSPPGDTYNQVGEGLPFFQGKSEFGLISPTAVKWCTAPTKTAKTDDILISVRAPVGPTNLADQDCCIGRGLAAIRVDSTQLNRDFLWLYLQHSERELAAKGQGSTFEAINGDDLRGLKVPLLPLDTQLRISLRLKAQLAEVETAREAVQAQWEEVQQLKSKALESVLAGVSNWQPMGCALRVQSGYAFKSEAFKRSGVRLLRNANILPGKVYWDNTVYLSEDDAQRHANYVLHAGDVLISLDRPIISSGIKVARVQATDLPALLLQRVGRFVLDTNKLDADYLYAYLQTERFMAQISGHEQSVGVPHISPGQVEAALMPLPDLMAQKEMAKRLTQITEAWSNAVAAIRKQGEDLAALPQRLLAQAFNDRGVT